MVPREDVTDAGARMRVLLQENFLFSRSVLSGR